MSGIPSLLHGLGERSAERGRAQGRSRSKMRSPTIAVIKTKLRAEPADVLSLGCDPARSHTWRSRLSAGRTCIGVAPKKIQVLQAVARKDSVGATT